MYNYEQLRVDLFTPAGFKLITYVRDRAIILGKAAGAFRAHEVLTGAPESDSWIRLAALDYLVETGDIMCVYNQGAIQHRVYILIRS